MAYIGKHANSSLDKEKKMKRFMVSVIFYFGLVSHGICCNLNVKEMRALDDPKKLDAFIAGVISGVLHYNSFLEQSQSRPLFCPKPTTVIDPSNARAIIYREADKLKTTVTEDKACIVSLLIAGLMQDLPCP